MTVNELIEKLKTFNPNLPVIINGYERGYNDLENVNQIEIILNVNHEWYYGKHEDVNSYSVEEKGIKDEPTLALHLN